MTYTYDEFLNAANSSGVMDKFSQQDLTVAQKNPEYGLSMVSLMKDISGATTTEQRLLATEAANQLRKNYGVYDAGGSYASSYGSQINDLLGKVNNYGSFNYGNETVYQQLLNSVLNQEAFSYDKNEDPTFSALKKTYLREGERASANALAQASAASGGQVSSYAAQAAQQANNYYAGQLADIIPTLEQNAYQKYLSDFTNRMNTLTNLQNDRAQAQENWMNDYNILLNNLSNLQQQDATDYQRYLDQVSQQQAAEQQAYERAKAQYNLLGYATPEIAQILGIPVTPQTVEPVQSAVVYDSGTPKGGSSMTDGERSWLLSNYPNGVISNATTWNELLSRHGADVLAAAGFSGPGGTGGVPTWQVNELKAMYPGGAVDAFTWNGLLGMYSADALAAAGIYSVQEQSQNQTITLPKKGSTGKNGMVTFS